MEFEERLVALAAKVQNQRDAIQTEEATKNAFIMPFISTILGYDVFNPLEIVPEFTADVGVKRGEKIDQVHQTAMKLGADNNAWDAFYFAVQGRIADSIEGYWQMLSRVGINHGFGITGETLGWEIAPNAVGRQ